MKYPLADDRRVDFRLARPNHRQCGELTLRNSERPDQTSASLSTGVGNATYTSTVSSVNKIGRQLVAIVSPRIAAILEFR
jgi:hypothetical protein